jgi:hypothetical protein
MHQTLLAIRAGRRQAIHTERLPDGAAGNLRTLVFVRQWIRADSAFNRSVRALAQQLIADCGPADFACEVQALFDYAQSIRFVRDPIDVERIADAETTVHEQQGDCVDKSILLASLLGSVGHLTRGKVVNFAGDVQARGFDHFYLEVQRPDGSWQVLDPTPENTPPGWEASGAVYQVVEFWEGTGGPALSGLLDDLLPGLIQQGVQLGAQFAASTQRQAQASSTQARQIGTAFDDLARQVTTLFDQIQRQTVITAADVARAAQAYQQLAAIAEQYGSVAYVAQQWNSAAYRQAYETRLQQIAARVVETESTATTNQPASPLDLNGLTSSPLFWPVALLVGVVVVMPLLSGRD